MNNGHQSEVKNAEQMQYIGCFVLIIQQQAKVIQQQEKTIAQQTAVTCEQEEVILKMKEERASLKDEILILKGEKKRPQFKPSKMDELAGKDRCANDASGKPKRPGSEKRKKTAALKIDEEKIIAPTEPIPPCSRFKGYRYWVTQELKISHHNIRYCMEVWETPEGKILTGKLPVAVRGGHFGPGIESYLLHQYHHCHVTQPLLREQLTQWGIDISTGQINALLQTGKERFHAEKEALLAAGLAVSRTITADDTGARHCGKNGYVTHIGNEFFAWFGSTLSKSRINFLQLLRCEHQDYWINDSALAYMKKHGLRQDFVGRIGHSPDTGQDIKQGPSSLSFPDKASWEKHLDSLGMQAPRHRQIATEGALLGSLQQHGIAQDCAIITDDAAQFKILLHGLCWIHAERLIHKLIPANDLHREDIALVRAAIWSFYADLKAYKKHPTEEKKGELSQRFDAIFTRKTRYTTLNLQLKRLHKNKSELLLVLERPDVALHTNGSENDLRERATRRKISGTTRSEMGRKCLDTFSSLKKTCFKLGISFWDYVSDRVHGINQIPWLPDLVVQRARAGPSA